MKSNYASKEVVPEYLHVSASDVWTQKREGTAEYRGRFEVAEGICRALTSATRSFVRIEFDYIKDREILIIYMDDKKHTEININMDSNYGMYLDIVEQFNW